MRPTVVDSIVFLPDHLATEAWIYIVVIKTQPLALVEESVLYHPGHPTKEHHDLDSHPPHPISITPLATLAVSSRQ
jgi:hypothetical protein